MHHEGLKGWTHLSLLCYKNTNELQHILFLKVLGMVQPTLTDKYIRGIVLYHGEVTINSSCSNFNALYPGLACIKTENVPDM